MPSDGGRLPPTAAGVLCRPTTWRLLEPPDNVVVNLLRLLHSATLTDKEGAMAIARTWQHPHHRVAGVCLLRISCAFPVFEPAPVGCADAATAVQQILCCPAGQLFEIRTRIFELFYAEWARVPWVSEEMDHATNLLLAALALKNAYPSLRMNESSRFVWSLLYRLQVRIPSDFLEPPLTSDSDVPFAGLPERTITSGAVTWQRFLPHYHVQEDD